MKSTSTIFSKETSTSKLLSFGLLDHHVFLFLFHQMEEGNGEDKGGETGGRVLAVRESGWCNALVIVMSMLRCIRCHDSVPPWRVTSSDLTLIEVVFVLGSSRLLVRFHICPAMSYRLLSAWTLVPHA